jgi:hypothetical protein
LEFNVTSLVWNVGLSRQLLMAGDSSAVEFDMDGDFGGDSPGSSSSHVGLGIIDVESFDVLQQAVAMVPCHLTRNALTQVGTMISGIDANLLKLMSHLGVTPVERQRMGMFNLRSSHSCSPCESPSKPQCPWCRSSKFSCEKHLVQHLNSAIANVEAPITKSGSCRFSADLHSKMMGLPAGTATAEEAVAFLTGFKNIFMAGEINGFDHHRCLLATDYLHSHLSAGVICNLREGH